MIRDCPSTTDPSPSLACSVSGVPETGQHAAANGEDPVHRPDAVLEVAALDRPSPPRSAGCRGRARRDRSCRRRLAAGNRYWRTSLINGSASASAAMQLRMSPTGGIPSPVAQDAGRATVVGHGDDRRQVAGVLLEAAEQRRQAGSAADRDDPRTPGEEALLVDQLHQRLVAAVASGAGPSARGSCGTRRTRPAPTPTTADDQPAQRERQELQGQQRR